VTIKWIKITTDMFNDEKITLIESMPDGESLLIIWLKILTLGGRCNANGEIILAENVPYTDQMLATIFKKNVATVRMALDVFEQFGMIHYDGKTIIITNWEKHQNVDGMQKIRNQNRERFKKFYEKKKAEKSNEILTDSNVRSNVRLTQPNATDKELELDNIYILSSCINHLNSMAGTNYKTNSKSTRRLLNARISEGHSLDDIKKVIDIKVAEWKGTNMATYLRPETLFGTKFESYLNQAPATKYDHKEELGRRFENVDEEPLWT
jgi:predicted phage replisome organizer/uncharacterized phage protein (TIGR02220 family)